PAVRHLAVHRDRPPSARWISTTTCGSSAGASRPVSSSLSRGSSRRAETNAGSGDSQGRSGPGQVWVTGLLGVAEEARRRSQSRTTSRWERAGWQRSADQPAQPVDETNSYQTQPVLSRNELSRLPAVASPRNDDSRSLLFATKGSPCKSGER